MLWEIFYQDSPGLNNMWSTLFKKIPRTCINVSDMCVGFYSFFKNLTDALNELINSKEIIFI